MSYSPDGERVLALPVSFRIAVMLAIVTAMAAGYCALSDGSDAASSGTEGNIDWSISEDTLTQYTVTFNGNGGTSETPSMTTGIDGKLVSLPSATRDGYTFDGWYTAVTGGEKITDDRIYTENTEVFAHWSSQPAPTPSSGGGNAMLVIGAVLALIAIGITGVILINRK